MPIDLDDIQPDQLCRMLSSPPQDNPIFSPGACWNKSYLDILKHVRAGPPEYVNPDWLPRRIEATPLLVQIPGRMPEAHEVATLWAYKSAFRARLREEILAQDGNSIGPVLDPLVKKIQSKGGNANLMLSHLDSPLARLHEATIAVVAQQKLLFNRARPWQTIPGLGTVVSHPMHASYPSGHATEAFCRALIWCAALSQVSYCVQLSEVMAAMIHQANRVAVNREIGGVHYPSDTMAGIELAQRIVALAAPKVIGSGPNSYTKEFIAFKLEIEALFADCEL